MPRDETVNNPYSSGLVRENTNISGVQSGLSYPNLSDSGSKLQEFGRSLMNLAKTVERTKKENRREAWSLEANRARQQTATLYDKWHAEASLNPSFRQKTDFSREANLKQSQIFQQITKEFGVDPRGKDFRSLHIINAVLGTLNARNPTILQQAQVNATNYGLELTAEQVNLAQTAIEESPTIETYENSTEDVINSVERRFPVNSAEKLKFLRSTIGDPDTGLSGSLIRGLTNESVNNILSHVTTSITSAIGENVSWVGKFIDKNGNAINHAWKAKIEAEKVSVKKKVREYVKKYPKYFKPGDLEKIDRNIDQKFRDFNDRIVANIGTIKEEMDKTKVGFMESAKRYWLGSNQHILESKDPLKYASDKISHLGKNTDWMVSGVETLGSKVEGVLSNTFNIASKDRSLGERLKDVLKSSYGLFDIVYNKGLKKFVTAKIQKGFRGYFAEHEMEEIINTPPEFITNSVLKRIKENRPDDKEMISNIKKYVNIVEDEETGELKASWKNFYYASMGNPKYKNTFIQYVLDKESGGDLDKTKKIYSSWEMRKKMQSQNTRDYLIKKFHSSIWYQDYSEDLVHSALVQGSISPEDAQWAKDYFAKNSPYKPPAGYEDRYKTRLKNILDIITVNSGGDAVSGSPVNVLNWLYQNNLEGAKLYMRIENYMMRRSFHLKRQSLSGQAVQTKGAYPYKHPYEANIEPLFNRIEKGLLEGKVILDGKTYKVPQSIITEGNRGGSNNASPTKDITTVSDKELNTELKTLSGKKNRSLTETVRMNALAEEGKKRILNKKGSKDGK